MTRWKDTLPYRDKNQPALKRGLAGPYALSLLSDALLYERTGQDEFLNVAGEAAATIRVWRKRLGVNSYRSDDMDDRPSNRDLLHAALHDVLSADMCNEDQAKAMHLRWAEASLRTVWRRHKEAAAAAIRHEDSIRALLRDEAEGLA